MVNLGQEETCCVPDTRDVSTYIPLSALTDAGRLPKAQTFWEK